MIHKEKQEHASWTTRGEILFMKMMKKVVNFYYQFFNAIPSREEGSETLHEALKSRSRKFWFMLAEIFEEKKYGEMKIGTVVNDDDEDNKHFDIDGRHKVCLFAVFKYSEYFKFKFNSSLQQTNSITTRKSQNSDLNLKFHHLTIVTIIPSALSRESEILNSIVWSSLDYHFLLNSQVFEKLIMTRLSFLSLRFSFSFTWKFHNLIRCDISQFTRMRMEDDEWRELMTLDFLPYSHRKFFVFPASSVSGT